MQGKYVAIGVAVLAAVGVVGFLGIRTGPAEPVGPAIQGPIGSPPVVPEQPASGRTRNDEAPPSVVAIIFTNAGYSPESLTVKKGTTVSFVNKSDFQTWPASAVHPTHEAYPGTSITRCGKRTPEPIFDACRGIPPGESWDFRFDETGTWQYHDHLSPARYGAVAVE